MRSVTNSLTSDNGLTITITTIEQSTATNLIQFKTVTIKKRRNYQSKFLTKQCVATIEAT